ncbi:hypothetical protein AAVH_09715 [Aphelenchoides avenae]|nr:hypothetical protein AAVH_09715 [Aphelenchus avenae]
MPSGSAQAPLRPSRAYVDAEGVFYSDEEEPNPKCKNNKDERGRGLCAQLGRMCGICLKRRPNRQAARKHKQRLLNTQRAHEERLKQLDGENRALRVENELLGQRVSSSVASSQNAHANTQGGAPYHPSQPVNVATSLINYGNVSVPQHPANPNPPMQHTWSGSAAVAVVQPYQSDRSYYDGHGNLSQHVGQDSRMPAATESWVSARSGFSGGTSTPLAGAGYVALAPPVPLHAHPCGSRDDVYVQQHALVFTSNAIPSQQSEWRAPSSVQAQPQEAIESEDWSGVGLTASNPAAGVDQTAADEAQSITASISPTYETTELDEELINLILQRDSYDMDPLLGNADEWTEPHRPPDAAQVASEGQCEEQAESSADEGAPGAQPHVAQARPSQQVSAAVQKASLAEKGAAGPESDDPSETSEENEQNPHERMDLERKRRNDAEETESSRTKKETLTGYWTKTLASPSETRSHNAERRGGPMPLESFKARRIASAREELRMARTALETLKQSPEPNAEAVVRMDAFVEKLASEIRDFVKIGKPDP